MKKVRKLKKKLSVASSSLLASSSRYQWAFPFFNRPFWTWFAPEDTREMATRMKNKKIIWMFVTFSTRLAFSGAWVEFIISFDSAPEKDTIIDRGLKTDVAGNRIYLDNFKVWFSKFTCKAHQCKQQVRKSKLCFSTLIHATEPETNNCTSTSCMVSILYPFQKLFCFGTIFYPWLLT